MASWRSVLPLWVSPQTSCALTWQPLTEPLHYIWESYLKNVSLLPPCGNMKEMFNSWNFFNSLLFGSAEPNKKDAKKSFKSKTWNINIKALMFWFPHFHIFPIMCSYSLFQELYKDKQPKMNNYFCFYFVIFLSSSASPSGASKRFLMLGQKFFHAKKN